MWINPGDWLGRGSTSCSVFITRPQAVVAAAPSLDEAVATRGPCCPQLVLGPGSSGCAG